MFTASDLSKFSSLLNIEAEDRYSYNYYLKHLGSEGTLDLYGLSQNEKIQYERKDKSKDYNLINRDFNKVIAEMESFRNSLSNTLKLTQRKLMEVERVSPNNYEDFNNLLNSLVSLKKEEFNTITSKAKVLKDKYGVLQKQVSIEKEGNAGSASEGKVEAPILGMARTISGAGGGSGVAGGIEDLIKGLSGASQASRFTVNQQNTQVNPNTRLHEIAKKRAQSGGGNYSLAVTKYGDGLRKIYKVNPSTGIGYLEYQAPDGETGIVDAPIKDYLKPVDYENSLFIDAAGRSYTIEPTNNIPSSVSSAWDDFTEDGVYEPSVKKIIKSP